MKMLSIINDRNDHLNTKHQNRLFQLLADRFMELHMDPDNLGLIFFTDQSDTAY